MKHLLSGSVGLVALLALGYGSAQAAPLPANISFDLMGSLQAITSSTFDQATGIDFGQGTNPITFGTPGGSITLGGAVNPVFTAAGFTTGSQGTVRDLTNLSVSAQNISNFYSFTSGANTLSFDLGAITYIMRTAANPQFAIAPSLNIYGTGNLFLTGYDATPGTFSLLTSNTGTGVTATFQSSVITGATAVPEPASLALLGAGLVGIGMIRRRSSNG